MIIDHNTPFVIYGAAGNGMRGYYSLKTQNNYNVIGFIDKRANEIGTQFMLPVWSLDSDFDGLDRGQCIVCVCIKNVFAHEMIVASLSKLGFSHFIFKPIVSAHKYSNDDLYEAIDRNYERIFGDTKTNEQYDLEPIPQINKICFFEYYDRALIETKQDDVIAAIPFERIFIDASDWSAGMKNCVNLTSVLALVPQISLFSLFNGSEGDMDIYLAHCASTIQNSESRYGTGGGRLKDTPAWRANIIENRRAVFEKMNESMELDFSFFKRNAPVCILDKSNRLIMQSAKHRAAFFIVKRRRYIPIRIKKSDYLHLFDTEKAKKFEEYLERKGICKLNTPIHHPRFYGYPVKYADYYEALVYPSIFEIAKLLRGTYRTEELVVCNALNDDGAISRCMAGLGFQTITVCQQENLSLCQSLDDLFHITASAYVDTLTSADILFVNENDWFASNDCVIARKMLFLLSACPVQNNIVGYKYHKIVSGFLGEGEMLYLNLYLREKDDNSE